MSDAYEVRVSLPINDESAQDGSSRFTFGSSFGYNQDAGPDSATWFWDGQDIWLPPENRTVYAMFTGTIHFIPNGRSIHSSGDLTNGEADEDTTSAFPAVGDSLLLRIWPQDFLELAGRLPAGAPIPKEVIYQNVDKDYAIAQAITLITGSPKTYKPFFTRKADNGAISDDVFRSRVTTWVSDRWANGQGMGILVQPGIAISQATTVPDPPLEGFPSEVIVDHFVPDGVDGWSRLTMKVITEAGVYFNPCFLFYVVANTPDDEWTTRPIGRGAAGRFVDQCCSQTESLPLLKVVTDLDVDIEYDEEPQELPPCLPDATMHLSRADHVRSVPAFFDMFDRPTDGLWRVNSLLPAGEYDVSADDHALYVADTDPNHISIV